MHVNDPSTTAYAAGQTVGRFAHSGFSAVSEDRPQKQEKLQLSVAPRESSTMIYVSLAPSKFIKLSHKDIQEPPNNWTL